MGKRRRKPSKKSKVKKTLNSESSEKSQKSDRKPIPSNEVVDMDDDCVHYNSSSEREPGKNTKEKEETEMEVIEESSSDGESDGTGEELVLTQHQSDESDVEVSVEFFDPREEDVSSIATFLRKYEASCTAKRKGEDAVTTARSLSEDVCKQTRVGTCVRITDEETPIGFISCLNIRHHAEVLADLKRKLAQVCEKEKDERFVKLLNKCVDGDGRFEGERMGLILCERVVNMPAMVVPKMLEALFCEIEWAREDEATAKGRDGFRFGWYLYITEVFYCKEESVEEKKRKEGKSKKRARSEKVDGEEKIAFGRLEDAAFFKYSNCSVVWDVSAEAEDKDVKRKRIAMIVAANKIGQIREMVEEQARQGGDLEDEETNRFEVE